MVGDYAPGDINGSSNSELLDNYLKVLSVVYMGIVSILLLNLLIALMGDSFGTVKSDSMAHWARHKAQICIDVGASGGGPLHLTPYVVFLSPYLGVLLRRSSANSTPVLYVRSDAAPVSVQAQDSRSLEKKVDEVMALLLLLKAHVLPAEADR
jgi:hypothetical protein